LKLRVTLRRVLLLGLRLRLLLLLVVMLVIMLTVLRKHQGWPECGRSDWQEGALVDGRGCRARRSTRVRCAACNVRLLLVRHLPQQQRLRLLVLVLLLLLLLRQGDSRLSSRFRRHQGYALRLARSGGVHCRAGTAAAAGAAAGWRMCGKHPAGNRNRGCVPRST
jgi:hypothetical protein